MGIEELGVIKELDELASRLPDGSAIQLYSIAQSLVSITQANGIVDGTDMMRGINPRSDYQEFIEHFTRKRAQY